MRVAQAFEVQHIPWLLLKGISLADSLYGGIANRPMVDNDIVVRRGDVVRAHAELRRLGFFDREGNLLSLNLAADFQHPMHFDHSTVQTGLELHWHVHPPELFDSDPNDYFERSVQKRTPDLVYRTLCDADRLLHLVTHWVQHGLNKPQILRDLELAWNAQLMSSTPANGQLDVPALAERAKRMGAFVPLCLALSLLERGGKLKVPVPGRLRSRRAEWFARAERAALAIVTKEPVEGSKEYRLRAASWALLRPRCLWRSASRELFPSRARLSRIEGRSLSRVEAVSVFFLRQRRATAKWLGR